MKHTDAMPPIAAPLARPVAKDLAIDWSAMDDEIVCPLCGYNMRGLKEARCPECGSRYKWADLFDPARRGHAFLYEYHDRSRIGSFVKTLFAGLRPVRFWRSIHPVLPLRVGRLRWYLFYLLSFISASFVFGQVAIDLANMRSRPWWRPPGNPLAPWAWTGGDWMTMLSMNSHLINAVVWFVVTFAAMLIFQVTMRRKKIRTAHLLRCMAYASDAFVWFVVLMVGLDLLEIVDDDFVVLQYLAFFATTCYIAVRLMIAFRIYLQFPNPVTSVLSTQIIAYLVILNMYLVNVWF